MVKISGNFEGLINRNLRSKPARVTPSPNV